ncbi:dUTP diphosphatase [Peptococcaceae bacterium 1198_IL3148]
MEYQAKIKVKKLSPDAQVPIKATLGSAGFDLHTVEEIYLKPGEHRAASTGLAFELPPGYAMLIYPRSGNAKKHGITLSNAVGVVDSDYRGEVKVLLYNAGNHAVTFQPGDRIAQAIIHRLPAIEIVECEELNHTARGSGGFGSTGN